MNTPAKKKLPRGHVEVVITSYDLRTFPRTRIGPFSNEDMANLIRSKGIDPARVTSQTIRDHDLATVIVGKSIEPVKMPRSESASYKQRKAIEKRPRRPRNRLN